MPIDKAVLENYVAELGLPADTAKTVLEAIGSNEAAATQFVGQRLRHEDYTKKTTALAKDKQTADAQLADFATQIKAADEKVRKIMSDFEKEKIGKTTAEARLQTVKTTYNLSDEDIPDVPAVPSGQPQQQQGLDVAALLDAAKAELRKEFYAEIGTFPDFAAAQARIAQQHHALFGETFSDYPGLVEAARKEKCTLEQAWERTYKVGEKRAAKTREEIQAETRATVEKEYRDRASADALAGVRPGATQSNQPMSPVLGRQFADRGETGVRSPNNPNGPQSSGGQPQQPPAQQPIKLTGGERAAAKWAERRNAGIPLGQPEPAAR